MLLGGMLKLWLKSMILLWPEESFVIRLKSPSLPMENIRAELLAVVPSWTIEKLPELLIALAAIVWVSNCPFVTTWGAAVILRMAQGLTCK